MKMDTRKYTFECITPCFCAGADQTQAEIRPSSIRGELRWWFRVLGGTREQEAEVFGCVEPARASSIQVRVADIKKRPVGALPKVQGIDPLSYILYFPSVSGETTGMRWQANACFGSGTTFVLQTRIIRKFSDEAKMRWENAVAAFRHYGSIGMHATRGLGAIQDTNINTQSWQEADKILTEAGFMVKKANRAYDDWKKVIEEAGKWLQGNLRNEFGAGGNKKPPQATALGSAQPVRQTSAVRLRPIKNKNNQLIFAAFEAPHDRVLGKKSKQPHREQILVSRDFTQPPPKAKQSRQKGNYRR